MITSDTCDWVVTKQTKTTEKSVRKQTTSMLVLEDMFRGIVWRMCDLQLRSRVWMHINVTPNLVFMCLYDSFAFISKNSMIVVTH